jgi:flagellar hook-basal body complex protein FliE
VGQPAQKVNGPFVATPYTTYRTLTNEGDPMASSDLIKRLETEKNDLVVAAQGSNFRQLRGMNDVMKSFTEANNLALKWLDRVQPMLGTLDDSSLQPLLLFMNNISGVIDRQQIRQGENIPIALGRITREFIQTLPLLIYELLVASGMSGLSDEDFPKKRADALKEIDETVATAHTNIRNSTLESGIKFESAVKEAITDIRKSVEEAEKNLERIKTEASHISVESALQQFNEAATALRIKACVCGVVTTSLFVVLVLLLICFTRYPPPLIHQIVESLKPGSTVVALPISIPLLIAASAYYTSIRLALVGVLGVGLAFSLRMTRAYLHMIEHNQHKLRVTKSIEAFVAAVRTKEQKDLVLSKLVESVTEFGDSGILGSQGETTGLPSVIFEAMTKNVGKSE